MGEVFFYHLTHSTLDATLRQLLEKSLAQGWRVLVRGRDPAVLAGLDAALWLGAADGFLPHGRAGGDHDAHQPVLLTTETAATGDRACVVAVDSASITPDEAAVLARAMIIFDGRDEAALAAARAQWKTLTSAGITAKYWSEQSGRWALKTES